MSKEYQALGALKNYLVAQMDAAPEPAIVAGQVLIDYPDSTKMPYPVTLYIVPDGGNLENLSTTELLENFNVKVYIIVKYSTARKSMALLISACFDYFAALLNCLNQDSTLGGSFCDVQIGSYDFYPAVAGLTNAAGLEVNLTLQIERPPLTLPGDILPGEYVIPDGG